MEYEAGAIGPELAGGGGGTEDRVSEFRNGRWSYDDGGA